ncbi:MAG: trypsin-like peptidase domain-containing protein [Chloroflexi bacterium]|nr:trypsin-like peptidase domain-containing protein [Chloroflexota bacterium]
MNAKPNTSLHSRLISVAAMVLLLAMSGTGGALISDLFFHPAAAAPVLYDEGAVVALYQRASPAVVEIVVVQASSSRFGFALPQQGQGSGFLVDTEGHILTNYHVVQGAQQIRVTLADGQTLEAQVAGTSPADDLALVRVDPQAVKGITPLPLGDSSTVRPGQMAIAIGSPFGLENTITVGVVSGVGRSRPGVVGRPITGMVQTDASINPGNSGGPLLNSLGEVIGINTSIETSAGGATGVGFAVPVDTAKSVLSQLGEDTTVARPWLGIRGIALSPERASLLSLTVSQGIYIVAVLADSPAEGAGLRGGGTEVSGDPGPGGDVITAADGRTVRSVEELASYLNGLRPGDTVNLTVIRSGQTLKLSVVLGKWPESLSSG